MAGPQDGHETSLMYAIGRVHQGLRREMRASLAPWSLSVQEYTTLSVLRNRPGLSNAQLARRALVTPQSMIEIIAKLEQRGLVERAQDPNHGLILRARLTTKGRGVLAEADPVIHTIEERLLASVPARDRAAVQRAMLAAMDSLSAPARFSARTR
jgi:DNA-binding MarR family transcriptional regulator